ncbi:hypothetical protein WDW89_00415 [Deltaproteobacteria bacterium TL4]
MNYEKLWNALKEEIARINMLIQIQNLIERWDLEYESLYYRGTFTEAERLLKCLREVKDVVNAPDVKAEQTKLSAG